MPTSRKTLPLVAATALTLGLSLALPVSAEAARGNVRIHTTTKTVVQGDTAQVKGNIVGAGAGTVVTIQQRRGGSGKAWGSGRQVTTTANGKYALQRTIKGKFTRDYRACVGPKNRRTCSLRARVEVVPRAGGITLTDAPATVAADTPITVRGTVEAALAGRPVRLEQLDQRSLAWRQVATGTVTPALTYELTGAPVARGKAQSFRVTSPAFNGRGVSVSNATAADVFAFYSLGDRTRFPLEQGGLSAGTATFTQADGQSVVYPSQVPSQSALLGTVRLGGACTQFRSAVFLDSPTARDTDGVNGAVETQAADGSTQLRFVETDIRRGERFTPELDITGAQRITLRQSAVSNAQSTQAPLQFGNPIVSCAF